MPDPYGYRREQFVKNTAPDRIDLTATEKILSIIDLAMILGVGLFIASIWNALPEHVPKHYNLAGIPDAYAGKSTLILMLGLMILICVVLTLVRRYPKIWNMPFHVTPECSKKIYAINADMISWIKSLITAIFAYLCIKSALVGLGMAEGLSGWFPIVAIIVIFIKIGTGIVYTIKQAASCSQSEAEQHETPIKQAASCSQSEAEQCETPIKQAASCSQSEAGQHETPIKEVGDGNESQEFED